MPVTRRWVTGQKAVNRFDDLALDQLWVFSRVPQERDFGKDGYLDVTTRGEFDGTCVAVQIKGGRSYHAGEGYRITASAENRRLWFSSPLPVIGIAWDPATEQCYWVDARALLREHGLRSPIIAPEAQSLTGEGIERFADYVRVHGRAEYGLLALGSDNPDQQVAGVYAALAQGRRDPRALVLLRRVIAHLAEDALPAAVSVLSYATPHPDVFWGPANSIDPTTKAQIASTFHWSPDEVALLLGVIDPENGVRRGAIGQCSYLLLEADPDRHLSVRAGIGRSLTSGRDHAAAWGLCLLTYWAGVKGGEVFTALVEEWPELASLTLVREVSGALSEFGFVSLE